MAKITKEAALLYHSQGKPGKIEVVPTKPYSTQTDLSLAYSPGVAEPCLEIEKNPQDAYKYTAKGNLVAVISNGTAVLGLGDIGALSGKPVMEGKGLLFKIYAGIDVFDIEVDEKDPEKFIAAVKAIAPTFGGINLEDIKAPECFEIERRLKEELDIPVMHDDQHGTAIISSAGLVNALQVAGKKIEDVKIVVNGAGASAVSCTKLYVSLGARLENIVMLDSKGVISKTRTDLNEQKRYFATDRTDIHTLEEAIKGADVFLGLSKGNVLSQDMVRSMAPMPIVFALANPTPEISYEDAMAARPDVLMATGRSDYPNQINNVIGFPYIFRGALDTQAKAINEEMKIAAVHAIANLAKQPVPDVVNAAYHVNNLSFGAEYFIPKPVDPRLITEVSCAVAKAAMESGVARTEIKDWDAYCVHLRELMGYESKLTRQLYDTARRSPQRVVFAEGIHPNMLKAAVEAKAEGICHPILLGNDEAIGKLAEEMERLKAILDKKEIELLLSDEYDANNAIITFHAGAGGTEAQDWTQMLIRMYLKWAQAHGFEVEELNLLPGDEAGVKNAEYMFKGKFAYGMLKSEKGVHRLVRISPFDAAKRRHTSFSAVDVMPEITDDVEVNLNMADVRVDYYRSSGAGGQHINKTSSAVRMTHLPTGIVASCQTERSQLQNKEQCLRMLRSKLFELELEKREKLKQSIEGEQQAIEWGSQIRSYVFQPYTLVKDNRTGIETGNIQAVMDGGLDEFIEGYLKKQKFKA